MDDDDGHGHGHGHSCRCTHNLDIYRGVYLDRVSESYSECVCARTYSTLSQNHHLFLCLFYSPINIIVVVCV